MGEDMIAPHVEHSVIDPCRTIQIPTDVQTNCWG